MTNTEILHSGQGSGILVHPDFDGSVRPSWFSADAWGQKAVAVDSGGRGSAWFINYTGTPMVLRHYLRGGYVASVSRDAYFYLGADKTRSFAEFRLLNHLHRLGLPVPKPVAARYERLAGIAYRASILIERIAGVAPLGDCLDKLEPSDWKRLGQLIRRFHDEGVYHADLNCFNVLVQGADFFLIDFDKGALIPRAGQQASWKSKNLDRLHRSLMKVVREGGRITLDDCWRTMMDGYATDRVRHSRPL